MMKRFSRATASAITCVLLALGALGTVADVRLPAGAVVRAAERDGVPSGLDAQHADEAPFLAAGGPHLFVPFEAPPRTGGARATGRHGCEPDEHSPDARAAALRIRTANQQHAAVARLLAVARAGRTELRSTPPPLSVS